MYHSIPKRVVLFSFVLSLLLFSGCVDQKRAGRELLPTGQTRCGEIDSRTDFKNRIETLNLIAHAYERGCYDQVIRYGLKAQSEYRQKTFSILRETSNLFLPDGTWVDYVLESYERAYLSFLIASSYYQQRQVDETRVELRRLDHELMAPLYNFGEDPVNILLQAVLWENAGDVGEARVDWNRLQDQKGMSESVRAFAVKRTEAIDRREPGRPDWKIYSIDPFPDLEWHLAWIDSKSGYFLIKPATPFPEGCASDTGVRLSTITWFEKIAGRHRNDYHPILNLQSWIRLPVGVLYGVTTFAFGTGLAVGGCALDIGARGNGDLCDVSVRAGLVVINESPEVVRKTLQPDLRHWEKIPSNVLVTTAEVEEESCFKNLSAEQQKQARRLL